MHIPLKMPGLEKRSKLDVEYSLETRLDIVNSVTTYVS